MQTNYIVCIKLNKISKYLFIVNHEKFVCKITTENKSNKYVYIYKRNKRIYFVKAL